MWVNDGINKYVKYSILVLAPFFYPAVSVTLLFLYYGFLSLIFALMYENVQSFRNLVMKHLFENDEARASFFFDYFWGNMWKKPAALVPAAVGSYTAHYFFNTASRNERARMAEDSRKALQEVANSNGVIVEMDVHGNRHFLDVRTREPATQDTMRMINAEREAYMKKFHEGDYPAAQFQDNINSGVSYITTKILGN